MTPARQSMLHLWKRLWKRLPAASLWAFAILALLTVCPSALEAAKIGDLVETRWWEQAVRFWTLEDRSVRNAFFGSIFLGISCGVLGSFIVVRKLALVGDTLSHAVLPGVALGFLWAGGKDPIVIFIGATVAGLVGTVLVSLIKGTTHIKEDSALGMVLAGFYAVGICLFTMIQRMPLGSKSGIDKFLFGQAAALSKADVQLMGAVCILAVVLVVFAYKELLSTSFDSAFARTVGIPVRFFHHLLMLVLAFSVVVALQAAGVVLVSALLIIPAATAYLLTDRMHWMLVLAAAFGCLSGVAGSFFSFLGNDLPTGPFMVLGASSVFATAFLFAPRYGLLPRRLRRLSRARSIQLENTLKAAYQVREASLFKEEGIPLRVLAERRNAPLEQVHKEADALVRRGLAGYNPAKPSGSPHLTGDREILLTPEGWQRACEIVRNHRLWELYLTDAAHYDADHVHEDAEQIEHILGDDIVRQLERRLNNPARDPHGKMIPSQEDIDAFRPHERPVDSAVGYRQPS